MVLYVSSLMPQRYYTFCYPPFDSRQKNFIAAEERAAFQPMRLLTSCNNGFAAIISVTAVSIISTPKHDARSELLTKHHYAEERAVTGSSAPNMAAGVEPMRWMESVISTSEMIVGNKASERTFAHSTGEGTGCKAVQKSRRTT